MRLGDVINSCFKFDTALYILLHYEVKPMAMPHTYRKTNLFTSKHYFKVILVSNIKITSHIFLHLIIEFIKLQVIMPRKASYFYLSSQLLTNNICSIIYEHSCKILYF